MSRVVKEVVAKHRQMVRTLGAALLSTASTARVHGGDVPELTVTIGRTRYRITVCRGEAHGNPFVDNCGICAPFWGYVVHRED